MIHIATAQSLSKHFNGIMALEDFSCDIEKNEILGLLGPNGAGKTTFFNLLTGLLTPDSGKAYFKGRALGGHYVYEIARLGIARTFQELRLIRKISTLENVLLCFRNQPGEKLFDVFFRPRLCAYNEVANRKRAIELLHSAGLLEKADDLADNLSYGQQKLLSLVCCLATDAELLLLDEPVAGIAPEMRDKILRIIRELPSKGKSVILIEHDIEAVTQVCDRVIFMDAGTKVSEGTPEEVRNDPRVIEAYID
jgi:ABC-type branched-subunit amino acid transport system ATPase component